MRLQMMIYHISGFRRSIGTFQAGKFVAHVHKSFCDTRDLVLHVDNVIVSAVGHLDFTLVLIEGRSGGMDCVT